MMFKNFGKQVETIWNDLRPVTKKMLVGALQTSKPAAKRRSSYDPHADWELSSLLKALDAQVSDADSRWGADKLKEINDFADVCASLLEAQTESAEVFIQLTKRALAKNDFKKIDTLADVLFERFTAPEIAEIIRQTEMAQIKAIAYETLAVMPTTLITPLLEDSLYFEIGCNVLEQQALEFESDDARLALEQLDSGAAFDDEQ